MIFVYNERQGVRDGQTVMASCLYIYGDRSVHGMRSLFIVYNILYAEMEISMDNNIFSHFPDRETFDRYWNENYVPVTYEDVATVFRDFVKSAEGHIYLSDYEEKGCISKEDFKDNLSQEAQFAFQDGLTEVFYDKNPELYETAFALFEEAQMTGQGDASVAQTFHETFNGLYTEFLDTLFEEMLSNRED